MKIRLIEPEPPGMNVYSMVMLPRLGLPIIGVRSCAAGARRQDLRRRTSRAIDWNDVLTRRPRRHLHDHVDGDGGLRVRRSGPRAKGIPVVMGGTHVTFMYDEALEHADFVARGEGGERSCSSSSRRSRRRRFDDIDGLVFRRDGETVDNELREPPRRPR